MFLDNNEMGEDEKVASSFYANKKYHGMLERIYIPQDVPLYVNNDKDFLHNPATSNFCSISASVFFRKYKDRLNC